MRWVSGFAKYEAKFEWHRWFAWYPTKLGNGQVGWLETIERRMIESTYDDYWQYRDIEKGSK